MDDGLTEPEFILETDIIATLMGYNFDDDSVWLNHDSTVWEQHPGIYLCRKGNPRINMPALDGRDGAPFPCMVSGERWTYAWPSRPITLAMEQNSDIQFPHKQYVINDHLHMPRNCKDQFIQDHLALLRRAWFGAQIIPEGRCSFDP